QHPVREPVIHLLQKEKDVSDVPIQYPSLKNFRGPTKILRCLFRHKGFPERKFPHHIRKNSSNRKREKLWVSGCTSHKFRDVQNRFSYKPEISRLHFQKTALSTQCL